MLTVIDDGVGFTGTPDGAGHDGLSNMKRRARELGGSLTIQSAPGSGTRIRLDAPLPAGAGA
jgi:signal transduction histidine kinase